MGLCHSSGAMKSYGVRRDGNTSVFAYIIFPGVGTALYWVVVHIGMGGGTERGSVMIQI